MSEKSCHCGKPLHYSDPAVQKQVEDLVEDKGECIEVTVSGITWLVPRHYIALHGLKGDEVATLGFQKAK